MCRWCSDIHVPSDPNDWTRPVKIKNEEGPTCPVCRAHIESKVRYALLGPSDTAADFEPANDLLWVS